MSRSDYSTTVSQSYDDIDPDSAELQYQTQSASANVIDIPLRDDQEVVTLNLDTDLPDDPTELCDLLENEEAGRQFWLAIGTAYSRLEKIDEAIEVIMRGLKAQVVIRGSDTERTPFHACLAWLYLKQSREAPRHTLSQSVAASKEKTKDVYQQLATQELNTSMKMFPSWPINLLARGVWTLLRSTAAESLDSASKSFDETIKQVADSNLLAFLGRARILYAKENYKGALKLYQQVLVARADMQPDPRIGIGMCFWKLGFKDEAKLAWERSLELDPENTSANVLMGLYFQDKAFQNITSPDFVSLYGSALQFTQKAYKNSRQKLALAGVTLASYLFSKKQQMDTVIKLCEKVIDYTDLPAIASDAYFWMARAYHHLQNYEQAMSCYQKSRAAKSDNVLAKVGMGQIQIINNDLTEAKLTFEKIIQEHPKCAEGMLMLGYLYAADYTQQRNPNSIIGLPTGAADKTVINEKTKAKILLERYLKLVEGRPGISTTEIDVYITLSRLYEDENIDQAMSSLEQAIERQKQISEGGLVHPRLLNNIAVLHYHKGQYDVARTLFQSALTQIASAGEQTDALEKNATESLVISLTYNLGRVEEQSGNVEEAKKLYVGIEERMPGYIDARLRLCYLALKESEEGGEGKPTLEQAVAKMQELIETDSANLEVRALHGWYLHQHQRKRPPAKNINEDIEQRHYKHTLQYYDKHDLYSLIAMGNIFLTAAREMRPTNEQEAERRRRMYEKAVEFFDKSLLLDPHNSYAAQGIAIALAEDRKFNKAVGIFGKIRETLNDVSAYINLGHCLTELKNYTRAIECYEIALNRFQAGKNVQTMMCLGRVWLQRGIDELSLDAVKVSLAYSKKALALSPNNLALKFNVAFCQFQIAEVVRRIPINDRKVSDIESAAVGLEDAIVALNEIAAEKHPPYPPAEIQQRATMGQNTMRRQLERLLAQQKEYEEKSEAKLEAGRRARDNGGNVNAHLSSVTSVGA
ncbi:hypothetical protein V1508DRAFT_412628 [Lipomyces doorenjongii]|uniref:uncharacterized protein n=1 Tax=Lipomyces doorenjongii TaxID=383834 RepID=UPI0034CD7B3F